MIFLYNVAGFFFLAAAVLPVLLSRRWRAGLGERLVWNGPASTGYPEGGGCIWIHGASVGEIMAASGLVDGLLGAHPSSRLVLSTSTVSGRETAVERYREAGERIVFTLLPLDWDGLPSKALDRCRPKLFVVLETELWPNLLRALGRRKCPAVLVNGRLSPKSFPRYLALRWFFRPFLSSLAVVCARSRADAERFRRLGVPGEKIRVTGNIKHEAHRGEALPARVSSWRLGRKGDGRGATIVAGSLRGREGRIILDAFTELRKRFPQLQLALAPRHPERFDTALLSRSPFPWVRWSEVPPDGPARDIPVVFVDTLGDLPFIYAVAAVAFVGGTLDDVRGHNLLEPAFHSVPVLYGPGYSNFEEEGKALVAAGGGFVTEDGRAFAETASRLLGNREEGREAGRKAREVADHFGGAVKRTMEAIEEVIEGGTP